MKMQRSTKAADEKAATLFKPTGAGVAGKVNLDAVRAMQRGEAVDEWDDDLIDDDDGPVNPVAIQRRRHVGGDANGDGDDGVDVADGVQAAGAQGVALTKVERRKQEKLAEKESRKQETAALITEQRRKRAEAEQKDIDAVAAEKARVAEEESAVALLRAERKQKEDEGYQQWIGHIAMESKGELGEEGKKEMALKEYLLHEAPISAKVHILEEVAAKFTISVDKLVTIMEAMIKAHEMSGVFDDRGKFIYVTEEEYQHVARFLRQRGRVSMSELIRETNRVITANEKTAAVAA